MPKERQPKVFVTNQSKFTFELIGTLAAKNNSTKSLTSDKGGDCGFYGQAV